MVAIDAELCLNSKLPYVLVFKFHELFGVPVGLTLMLHLLLPYCLLTILVLLKLCGRQSPQPQYVFSIINC